MTVYADGNHGEYTLSQANSVTCGFIAYPAAGTLMSTSCGWGDPFSGTNDGGSSYNPYALVGQYADGNGGIYEQIIENYSSQCGYVQAPEQG